MAAPLAKRPRGTLTTHYPDLTRISRVGEPCFRLSLLEGRAFSAPAVGGDVGARAQGLPPPNPPPTRSPGARAPACPLGRQSAARQRQAVNPQRASVGPSIRSTPATAAARQRQAVNPQRASVGPSIRSTPASGRQSNPQRALLDDLDARLKRGATFQELGFKSRRKSRKVGRAGPALPTREGEAPIEVLLAACALHHGKARVPPGLFRGDTSMTSIKLPTGLTSLGSGAFADCTAMTSIVLPDTLTSIGEGAFAHCSGIPRRPRPAR